MLELVLSVGLICLTYFLIERVSPGKHLLRSIVCTVGCSYTAYRLNVWYHGWQLLDLIPITLITVVCFLEFWYLELFLVKVKNRVRKLKDSPSFVSPTRYQKTAVSIKGSGWVKPQG